ncbi:MAG: AAA family ATPase, partial [Bacteroidales bacterium]|nr:AAA family ATPase [Bacteroidales bacterium]
MGQFIDRENYGFRSAINSDFVDKSGLLNILNRNLGSENRFMCISRPRRFGKSVAAEMAYAYYDRKSNSRNLFEGLEITKSPDYEKHLNKYPTIFIDWNTFANIPDKDKLKEAQKSIIADLKQSYDILEEKNSLSKALAEINLKTGDRFILIIDEWDMLVRDVTQEIQDEYVDFLRSMFKSADAKKTFLLVYMTGILPIIKIKTQSALNNFREYSIIYPAETAKYYGFTEPEVEKICKDHG